MPIYTPLVHSTSTIRNQKKKKNMEIPVLDFSEFEGEKRSNAMKLLHEACEKWGFFMV